MPFSYPQYVGVVLWSNDPNAGGPPHGRIGATKLPARSLHPGGTLQRLIALNRHVTLHTPGQYTISYQMLGRREATNSAVACQTAKQKQFQIILNSGKPREEVVQNYIDGLHSGVMPRVEESAEMLIWTRDVAVIASLGAAAGHVPTLSFDIARALEEFLQNPEGHAALLEVMVVGDVSGRIHGFRLFDEHALTVPADGYKRMLAAGGVDRTYMVLEHLMKHGSAQHSSLVKPFLQHHNSRIRRVAREFIDTVEGAE